jgi:hypothetical protein
VELSHFIISKNPLRRAGGKIKKKENEGGAVGVKTAKKMTGVEWYKNTISLISEK